MAVIALLREVLSIWSNSRWGSSHLRTARSSIRAAVRRS